MVKNKQKNSKSKTSLTQEIHISSADLDPEALARHIAEFAVDKKAEDITILDMREIVNYCDYFVVATGNTDRHVKAIADAIDKGVADLGINIRYKQGLDFSSRKGLGPNPLDAKGMWVLLDMGDVVAHIFEPEAREFYDLENLWREAASLNVSL